MQIALSPYSISGYKSSALPKSSQTNSLYLDGPKNVDCTVFFSGTARSPERQLIDRHLEGLRAQLEKEGNFNEYIFYSRPYAQLLQEQYIELQAIDLDNRLVKLVKGAAQSLGFRIATRVEAQAFRWEDPEQHRIASERMRKLWEDPTFRAAERERRRNQWRDPAYREKMCAISANQRQVPRRSSTANAVTWRDPTLRRNAAENMCEQWKDPQYRANIQAKMRDLWKDGHYRSNVLQGIYQALGERRNWVQSVETIGSRDVSDSSALNPVDIILAKEEVEAEQQTLIALDTALDELQDYSPTAYLLIMMLFGFTSGMEDVISELDMSEQEQSETVHQGLNFLREKLSDAVVKTRFVLK
jgi:hypothetical protein